MKDRVQPRPWQPVIGICLLSVLSVFTSPPVLHATTPNVVLSRAIHFPTISGTPVTLSPGKYLVEQAGSEELRVTAVADKQEFLIQAEPLSHEQYELFSPMALTRYSKNHEFLINLFLPGGVRLVATGSSKELPKPIPGQGPPPISPIVQTPVPPSEAIPPVETPPIPAPTPAPAPDPEPPTPPQTTPVPDPVPSVPPIIEEPPMMAYQPPTQDQPGFRIDGNSSDSQYPSVFVLAPNHVGHTSQEYPVLYWYLSQSTQDPLDVMIAEEGNLEVLLDIRLLPPLQEGIHELRLEDYGISLLPNVPYRWTVRIISSQGSEAITASGAIQRIQTADSSSTSLAFSPEGYAQKGQWYDALTVLANLIQDNPTDAALLAQRSALLEQVGLTEPAAFGQNTNSP